MLLSFYSNMNLETFQWMYKVSFWMVTSWKKYILNNPRILKSRFFKHVNKLNKALYGIKRAPGACIKDLVNFLSWFTTKKINSTLFVKWKENNLLLLQIHVDYITFGASNEYLCEDFPNLMKNEFEMNIRGYIRFGASRSRKQVKVYPLYPIMPLKDSL